MSDGDSPTDRRSPTIALAEEGVVAKHMSYVGMVATAWAELEITIDLSATRVARIPYDVGVCFTAQVLGSNRKLDAYIAIVRLRGVKRFNGDLELFAKDTATLAERRNRVVHDPWIIIGNAPPSRFEATARRSLRLQYVEMPTEDVLKLGDEILDHTDRFRRLHEKIMAAGGTLR
jgi:hypothetical protein